MAFFNLPRFCTSLFPPKEARSIQTVVEKLHNSKSNFFTKCKSLPVININLLVFHFHRLSMLIEFMSVLAPGMYPPTPAIPSCHPVCRTAAPGQQKANLGQCPGRSNVQIFSFVILGGSNCRCIEKIHSRNLILYLD